MGISFHGYQTHRAIGRCITTATGPNPFPISILVFRSSNPTQQNRPAVRCPRCISFRLALPCLVASPTFFNPPPLPPTPSIVRSNDTIPPFEFQIRKYYPLLLLLLLLCFTHRQFTQTPSPLSPPLSSSSRLVQIKYQNPLRWALAVRDAAIRLSRSSCWASRVPPPARFDILATGILERGCGFGFNTPTTGARRHNNGWGDARRHDLCIASFASHHLAHLSLPARLYTGVIVANARWGRRDHHLVSGHP